jgi:ADP-ribose pyrophosphatase YjhB (NUDIX family)
MLNFAKQSFIPVQPVAPWKNRADSHPQCVVSGFAVDKDGRFPILFRSDKVRSAKNAWSIPSGLHEVGLTKEQQFCNELMEELGVAPALETCVEIGSYENIIQGSATEDPWHWDLHVLFVLVETLDCLVNKEPDKHSKIELVKIDDLPDFSPWAPGLGEFLKKPTTYERFVAEQLFAEQERFAASSASTHTPGSTHGTIFNK